MPLATYQGLMLPLLQELADGKEHAVKDVREAIAKKLGLTAEDRNEILSSAGQSLYDNRLGWAKTYMGKAGLLESPKRGVYRATARGQKLLSTHPKRVDNALLTQFEEFNAFIDRPAGEGTAEEGAQPVRPPPQVAAEQTPREALERAYLQLRREVESELLESVRSATPAFFERLVVQLLVGMGYGGSLQDAGRALGRSHDGGIDGMIKEDHLGLDVIYLQAKRWKNTVGRPDIQGFAGSLEGARARKGVFITTSTFSQEAKQYVANIERKIVLLDGVNLAALMFDFGIGVNAERAYEVKRVDSDFFSEE